MITIEALTKELETRGYTVHLQDVVKNSIKLTGLTLRTSESERIAPCIYVDRILEEFQSPEKAADTIEQTLSSAKSISIEPDEIITRANILANAHIAVQRESEQELIKRSSPIDGIEEYVFIQGNTTSDGMWSVKLLPSHLSMVDITEDEVWEAAERNTFTDEEISINSMQSILAEIIGMQDDLPEIDMPMYVITNRRKINGAVQIFNKEAIKKWADDRGFKRLIMLPSSVSEVIVIPADDNNMNLDELSEMVQQVNATQVSPEEQLADRAYVIDLAA